MRKTFFTLRSRVCYLWPYHLRQSMANCDNELTIIAWNYFGCTCTLARRRKCSRWRSTTASISRSEQTAKRQERRVMFAKTHRSSRKLGGINHATTRCVSAVAEVTKRNCRVFWRNWWTLRTRASSFLIIRWISDDTW